MELKIFLYLRKRAVYARMEKRNGGRNVIRKMQMKDASAVSRICTEAMGYPAQEDQVRQRIAELESDPAYFLVVAEQDGEAVGFLQAQKYDVLYAGRGWNIISLAVAPERQKTGLGRQLLEALEVHAANTGSDFIRLNSRIEREDAHAFYCHMGYQCDKTQRRFMKKL